MSNLCIFLNTRVENSGALAWIGDKGLAPFRYLFNGKTIRVQPRVSDQEIKIHHIASFHKKGYLNFCKTNWDLESSSTGMIKTALSIVFLIPGFILGAAFKALSYLFTDVREKHGLAKKHLTPVNREIGTVSNPITNIEELTKALDAECQSNPTNALIIHGDGNLKINEDPGILNFNPMKLVLEGAKIVHEPSVTDRLEEAMLRTGKWQLSATRVVTSTNLYDAAEGAHKVNSIDDALQAIAPRRNWTSCKRYHMIFNLARPQIA